MQKLTRFYKSKLPSKKKPDPVPIIMMYAQFNRSLWDEILYCIDHTMLSKTLKQIRRKHHN